jgi:hypothetical protein
MRCALQFAAVALYTVLAGTASVAHAAGLAGSTVITTLYNPTLATVLGGPTSATVGANTPTYPSGSITGNTAFQINVTSTQIVYNPLVSVTYGNGPFNGFVFNFAGAPNIIAVTLDPASTFTPTAISFTANSVSLNLSGNTVSPSSAAILDIQVQPSGSQYYFSQLAFAGGWQMTLTYVNYSPRTITCVTNFYSDAGGALSVPFGGGTVSSRTDILQPGQSIHDQSVANLNATVSQGWAQAACDGPVQASLLYRLYTSGVPVGEAGVNAETAPTTEFATFAQTATGVAYANPSTTQSAAITLKVFNAAGAPLGSTVITLGPLAHGAANLGPLLGLQSFTGFVKVTSTIPIISLSLNFEAFPVFSSLPPGDLPSSTTLVN